MFTISLDKILKAVDGVLVNFKDTNFKISSVVIDNRDVKKNSVFIAIIGKKFDGHSFVEDAIKKGAIIAITERKISNFPQIIVKNTRAAFLKIAELNRSFFKGKVVGVTGSVGKTTTKDMIFAVLEENFKTIKTIGNLNNEIGMSKTMLTFSPGYDAAVVEMGMSSLGEIAVLSKALKPAIGMITNIGVSHLEFLKTKENILKAKLEILEGMPKNSPLILNIDDQYLKNIQLKDHKIITCGIENKKSDYLAEKIEQIGFSTKFILYKKNEALTEIVIPTIGSHNILNSLFAVAVGDLFSIPIDRIKKALENFNPSDMRQKIHQINGITLIADYYNASPESAKAAISSLSKIDCSGRKIAVLGDMLELGSISKEEHFKLGEFSAENKLNFLFCTGEESKEIVKGAKTSSKNIVAKHFNNKQDLITNLKETLKKDDVILLKASRAMNFEEIFNNIAEL